MSTIPAFSPGPCKTSLLRVGNRFRCTRDDLYEQCSLHITLKMPSSVRVGSRPPRSCLIFSNSSGVRPCSRIISGVTAAIAEVVIGESSLSHLHQLFACGFVQDSLKKRSGRVVWSGHSCPLHLTLSRKLENRDQHKNQDRPQNQINPKI